MKKPKKPIRKSTKDNIPSLRTPKRKGPKVGYNYPIISEETRSREEVADATQWAKNVTEEDLPVLAKLLPVLADPMKAITGMTKEDKTAYNKIKMNKSLSAGEKTGKLLKLSGRYLPPAVLNVALGAITTPTGAITGSSLKKGAAMLNNTLNPTAYIKGGVNQINNDLEMMPWNIRSFEYKRKLHPLTKPFLATPIGRKVGRQKTIVQAKKESSWAHKNYEESLKKFTLKGNEKALILDLMKADRSTYKEAVKKADFIKENHGYAMYLHRNGLLTTNDAHQLDKLMDDPQLFKSFEEEYLHSTRAVVLNKNRFPAANPKWTEQEHRFAAANPKWTEQELQRQAEEALILGRHGTSGPGTYTSNSGKIRKTFSTPENADQVAYWGDIKMKLPGYDEALTPREKLGVISKNVGYGEDPKIYSKFAYGEYPIMEQPYGGAAERIFNKRKPLDMDLASMEDYARHSLSDGGEKTVKEMQEYLELSNFRKAPESLMDPNIKNKMGIQGLSDAEWLPNTFYMDNDLWRNSVLKSKGKKLWDMAHRQQTERGMPMSNDFWVLKNKINNNKNLKDPRHKARRMINRDESISQAQELLRIQKSIEQEARRSVVSEIKNTGIPLAIGATIASGASYGLAVNSKAGKENSRINKRLELLPEDVQEEYRKKIDSLQSSTDMSDWKQRKKYRKDRKIIRAEYSSKPMNREFEDGGSTDPGKDLLQRYYEATGNNIENFEKFQGFLSTLAEAESFSGKKQYSDEGSTAKGIYHYLDDSVETSDQRILNLFDKHNVDKELQKEILEATKGIGVQHRSRDIQSIMVLSDLMQSPKAPYRAWQRGEVEDRDLYYEGHFAGGSDSISSKEQVYANWENAGKRLPKVELKPEIMVHERTKEDYLNMIGDKEYLYGGPTDMTGSGTTFTGENTEFSGFNKKPKNPVAMMGENPYLNSNLAKNFAKFASELNINQDKTPSLNMFGGDPVNAKPLQFGNDYSFNSGFDSTPDFGSFGTSQPLTFGNNFSSSNFDITGGVSPYDLTASSNFGETAGSSGISGSGWGAIAGTLGSIGSSFLPSQKENDNREAIDVGSYDPTARFDMTYAKKYNKDLDKQEAVMDVASAIPFIGGFVSLGRTIGEGSVALGGGKGTKAGNALEQTFNPLGHAMEKWSRAENFGDYLSGVGSLLGGGSGINALFENLQGGPKKASDEEKMNDYLSLLRPENARNKKAMYDAAFGEAKEGGVYPSNGNGPSPELVDGGAYAVQGKDTHETNPHRGYTFSVNSDGTKNKAAAGELVIDGPNGQKLVFTDEF